MLMYIRDSSPQLPANTSPRYVVGLGISALMIVISSSLVALRFVSRHITKSIKWDDWLCLMSLLFAYGILVITALSGTVGRAGYHVTVDTTHGLAKFYKVRFPPKLNIYPVAFYTCQAIDYRDNRVNNQLIDSQNFSRLRWRTGSSIDQLFQLRNYLSCSSSAEYSA